MALASAPSPNRFARRLFSPLPSRYDNLAEILSFGQNGRWRREMVSHAVGSCPRRVLDVACGTAGVSLALARASAATVVGVDLTEPMVTEGARRIADVGLSSRVLLLVGRAEQLPFPDGSFDALTFTYLLRYVEDPFATLGELARVVRPGGLVASLEFFVPPRRIWRGCWWLYTRLVLPVAGLVTGGRPWGAVGRFLGPSISEHYRRFPPASIVEAWRRAGLEDVSLKVMSLGGGLVMWGRRAHG